MNDSKTQIPESHKDLLSAPVAVLATSGADGFPQVSALWFLYDDNGSDSGDGALRLSLNSTRQKVKNMQETPQVTLFILDPANPYRTLEIRARAELSPDTGGEFAMRLGHKYGGVDVRSNDRPGETRLVVTLRPVKVNTWG
ncbi:MAG TPA: PPOX class F420-dependent oxidoreductase [Chloroflexia bacterium]|jgi:PPOX class probable F420-dependent enzyme